MQHQGIALTASPASRVLRLGELLASGPSAIAADAAALVVAPIDPRVELDAMKARVIAEAREVGLKEGRARAQLEVDKAVKQARADIEASNRDYELELRRAQSALAEVFDSLQGEIERLDQRAIDDACVLAMKALTRVVGEHAMNGEAMAGLCSQLLQEFKVRPLTISVAPEDAGVIETVGTSTGVAIAVDPSLSPGECRLDSHRGRVVTSLADRLHAIADALGFQESMQ